MTDRRPDIHCTGCGTYCYSLSHLPWEQVFPGTHYCAECQNAINRGIRSGAMLNRAWYGMVSTVQEQLQKARKNLTEAEKSKISSFGWTMRYSCTPKERPYKGDPNKMTPAEWREIAKEKLAQYRQYCNRKELTLLNALIKAAGALEPPKRSKAA